MSKAELLAAWEQVEQEMYQTLTADTFTNAASVQVPWGESAPCKPVPPFIDAV